MVSPFFFLCVTFHIADEFYSRLLFLVVLQPLPDGIVAYPIFTTNCRISQLIDFSNQYVKWRAVNFAVKKGPSHINRCLKEC